MLGDSNFDERHTLENVVHSTKMIEDQSKVVSAFYRLFKFFMSCICIKRIIRYFFKGEVLNFRVLLVTKEAMKQKTLVWKNICFK